MNNSGARVWAALGLLGAVAVVMVFAGLTRSEHRAREREAWEQLIGVWEAGKTGYITYFVEHSCDDQLVRTYGRLTPREGEELEHARHVRKAREYLRDTAVEEHDPAQDEITRRGEEFWQRTRRIEIARMPPRGGIQEVSHVLLIAERDGNETSLRAEAFLIDRNSHTEPGWADQLRLIFEPQGVPLSVTWK